jgi:hypothetical protein
MKRKSKKQQQSPRGFERRLLGRINPCGIVIKIVALFV